jgi:hypothetical protein
MTDHAGMYEVLRLIEQANQLARSLPLAGLSVFDDVSLEPPRLTPPELGCIRLVSWLFVQHFEAGRIGVAFLEGKVIAYTQDPDGAVKKHRQNVQRLRTFFQHNLDSRKPHDQGIHESCLAWFKEKCGTAVPATDAHWAACLSEMIRESAQCLEILVSTLRMIESDEYCEQICQEWCRRVSRTVAPHQFDELIAVVGTDMGRPEIDPPSFRKRNFDSWTKHLALLSEAADVQLEARKLVENAMLTVIPDVLPITGKDIIQELQIEPGPLVGRLLAEARNLYGNERLSREQLLGRLLEISRLA